MAAVLVEYLDDSEPLTFKDVAAQCRIDDDDERDFIERIVIPSARQAAESKSGAAIRKARYVERIAVFPMQALSLSLGQVVRVESVVARISSSAATTTLDVSTYELVQLGRESLLAPLGECPWPNATAVTITYQAGIDLSRFPSVRSWMLLAAAWAYDHRELFAKGQALTAMPGGYAARCLRPSACRRGSDGGGSFE
ncbi:hypothetical protein AWB80_03575 [Caballeronia pedi]|uniref:Phage gp6-like head-tail connector protein n=1 Tax=Caballeronia pedi TaxID=1777141 RepID=A0A158BHF1_9BURK|nr:hypothetical protein [Caballeronia pedi]SAK69518.1 hypothetical protein AWB80_03575 [Caballeronia pedi]